MRIQALTLVTIFLGESGKISRRRKRVNIRLRMSRARSRALSEKEKGLTSVDVCIIVRAASQFLSFTERPILLQPVLFEWPIRNPT